MKRLRIAPIVEGHGEVQSVRTLLQRIGHELFSAEYIEVLQPIREHRGSLSDQDALARRVELAVLKLNTQPHRDDPKLILLLLDADDEKCCELGPRLLSAARKCRSDVDIACVAANREYETWFAAAAESLQEYLELEANDPAPLEPEKMAAGKGWVQKRFRGTKYSPRVDQPRMTAKMDLQICRLRSPSFDKLCREMAQRLR